VSVIDCEDPRHERHERGVDGVDVERDDGGTGGGQPRHQTVPDLSAGARDQRNRFAHRPHETDIVKLS
jgi:hypothetical protein